MAGNLVKRIKWVVLGILLVLVLMLISQNTESVALRFFFWDFEMPKLVLAVLCLLAGMAAGFVLAKQPWDR